MASARHALVVGVLIAITCQTARCSGQKEGEKESATCTLALKGFGGSKHGIRYAELACLGSATPLEVGINKTHLGKYAPDFTGVVVSDKPCAEQVPVVSDWLGESDDPTAIPQVTIYPLLCFSGDYEVVLQAPAVENISLGYESTSSGYSTALLVSFLSDAIPAVVLYCLAVDDRYRQSAMSKDLQFGSIRQRCCARAVVDRQAAHIQDCNGSNRRKHVYHSMTRAHIL